MNPDFTPEQRRYLEGLVTGMVAARELDGVGAPSGAPTGPDAAHLLAMARFEASGAKLTDQEKFKREEHPLDAYARMKAQAERGEYPKPADNFRWRFHGLFYVAPNQNSFMCRLRLPNGILNHWQLAGLALLAETHGGGYAHVTTRANFQIREIEATKAVSLVEAIQSLGLHTRGSGADNIRNVTGTPTAGIDPHELLDTRPFARAWHFHVLNDRSLSALPRKFNVAFDGAGCVSALEDTNDIGFQAVEVVEGGDIEPGVWFRLAIGGITGHQDFARPTGLYLRPEQATAAADAIVRVFIDHGNRTDRTKARLKYLLDEWGFEKFLIEVEARLGAPLTRIADDLVRPRHDPDRLAHIGVHKQKQPGLNWVGVVLATGHIGAAQMQGLASIAARFGDGDIRLTVWQNLLISGVPDGNVEDVVSALALLDLKTEATPIRAGLVACTGNTGCKFANADTKGTAEQIAQHIEARLQLDTPINVHLTGCHHSCAQHYIGDIGLVACKIDRGGDGESIEGFHVIVGGGSGNQARIGRELYRDIAKEDCPHTLEHLLAAYLAHRSAPSETFYDFAGRHDVEALRALAEEAA
jgi:ferredoxin-nitrite reductase